MHGYAALPDRNGEADGEMRKEWGFALEDISG